MKPLAFAADAGTAIMWVVYGPDVFVE